MESPLFILQISDCHILAESGATLLGIDTEQSLRHVLKYAYKKEGQADLILLSGDLAEQPCQSSYQKIVRALQPYNTHTLCLPGNHDDLRLMQRYINLPTLNCAKHTIVKNWQLICLNSQKVNTHSGYVAKSEQVFLTDVLTQHPGLNTLVAIHHHVIATNSHWMDGMIVNNKEELLTLIRPYSQVKAISCGHIHQALEVQIENLLLLGTPSTCFQFKPHCTEYTLDDKTPGYRVILLYPDGSIKTYIQYLPPYL